MKQYLQVILITILTAGLAFAHGEDPNVMIISKATELAVHRVEKLVTLKKIDVSFQDHLVMVRAERSNENGASYKVHATVAPGSDGKSHIITLWMDKDGRTLAHQVFPGSQPVNAFRWPEKDAVTLHEEALHFILEMSQQYPEVKPYYTGLETVSLTPVVDAQGNLVAQFKVTSDDSTKNLIINLKPDGTYISHQLN